jgi:hypothetical protein
MSTPTPPRDTSAARLHAIDDAMLSDTNGAQRRNKEQRDRLERAYLSLAHAVTTHMVPAFLRMVDALRYAEDTARQLKDHLATITRDGTTPRAYPMRRPRKGGYYA